MTVKDAYQILGVPVGTDFSEIKKRYRQLMLQVHPDSLSLDSGNIPGASHPSLAREITVAYSILKNSASGSSPSASEKKYETVRDERETGTEGKYSVWNAPVNLFAYREREILHYAEDSEGTVLGSFCIARGKYLWTTEEDFPLFLLSITRCGKELLDGIDDKLDSRGDSASWFHGQQRSQVLAELVYLLAQQFIDSTALLHELARKEMFDKNGNSIFYIPAMLETSGTDILAETSEPLFPSRLRSHRLYLKSQSGQELGYLSFPDDRLYYAVIPLFEQRRVQIRIQLAEVQSGKISTGKTRRRWKEKGAGGYRHLHLWIKLPAKNAGGSPENLNLQIEQLLNRCLHTC